MAREEWPPRASMSTDRIAEWGVISVTLRSAHIELLFIWSKADESCADNPKIVSSFSWDKYKVFGNQHPLSKCVWINSYTERRLCSEDLPANGQKGTKNGTSPFFLSKGQCQLTQRLLRRHWVQWHPGAALRLHHPWAWNPCNHALTSHRKEPRWC